jgi:hypothetical protein
MLSGNKALQDRRFEEGLCTSTEHQVQFYDQVTLSKVKGKKNQNMLEMIRSEGYASNRQEALVGSGHSRVQS